MRQWQGGKRWRLRMPDGSRLAPHMRPALQARTLRPLPPRRAQFFSSIPLTTSLLLAPFAPPYSTGGDISIGRSLLLE
ncbi:hypothetical protein PR202_gb23011 [Eleusine coracana subsp. coracana]|uniref:Uncharacterized protein n=1 Tax=Eleusine coracana subsp. coracana TaxID=191504 RepID=A0AAV5FF75_ELECO|nr:hypothetical protein PR202_gb23011 [Eleusine coracana subsp. coracana]